MPAPNPNERRPTSSAGETPLQPAPPVPGAAPLPSHPEQRLGPAPALPVRGGAAAGGTAAERPLAHAPLPARPALAVPQIPAAPAVPLPGPSRPGPQETPLRPVTGGPIGSRPEVPLARPGEVRGAAWVPPSAVPVAGQAPAVGVTLPAPNPAALYGTTAGAAPMPAASCRPAVRPEHAWPTDCRPPARRGSNHRRIRRRCRRPAPAANRPSRLRPADRLVAACSIRPRGAGGHGRPERKRSAGLGQDQHRQIAPPRVPCAFVGAGGDLPDRSRHVPDRNGGRPARLVGELTESRPRNGAEARASEGRKA